MKILVNRWSWGRLIYWGIILFLIFFFLSLFFYDTSIIFKTLVDLLLALISLLITFWALRTFKLFSKKITENKQLKFWRTAVLLGIIFLLLAEHVPANIIQVFQNKFFLLDTLIALAAAIFEESVCRGLLFSGFLGHEIYESSNFRLTKAALYSSLLFALFHLVNLIGGDSSAVFEQIGYTFAGGILFAALRVMTNRLFWVILVHFMIDWGPWVGFSQTSSNWFSLILVFGPLLVISLGYLISVDKLLIKQTALKKF